MNATKWHECDSCDGEGNLDLHKKDGKIRMLVEDEFDGVYCELEEIPSAEEIAKLVNRDCEFIKNYQFPAKSDVAAVDIQFFKNGKVARFFKNGVVAKGADFKLK